MLVRDNVRVLPRRLFKRTYLGIIHFALLLVLFGAAASKAQHTPLLTAMLLSELPSIFYIAGWLQVGAIPKRSNINGLLNMPLMMSILA